MAPSAEQLWAYKREGNFPIGIPTLYGYDRNYLIQARRLAAYLQAGLLVPQEEETLTVRATRDALAKLDANPERLLN